MGKCEGEIFFSPLWQRGARGDFLIIVMKSPLVPLCKRGIFCSELMNGYQKGIEEMHCKYLSTILLIFLSAGCSHAISKEVRSDVADDLSIRAVFENPLGYKGKTVMLGGVIIETENRSDGTYIEVIQKPLDSGGRPEETDLSMGRFIVFSERFLDALIYSNGRELTVAGELIGVEKGMVGGKEYTYPIIRSREMHLFKLYSHSPLRFGIGVGIGGSF
jgi:outer membrane lipoprotein